MSQLLQYYKNFQQSRNPIPAVAPTFEDLSIDVNLTEIQRLIKYAKSSIGLQRLVHVKMLAGICVIVGFAETKSKVIPLLEALSRDTEPAVKQHFAEQLGGLAKFCFADGGEDGYNVIVTRILPIVARMLEDDKGEVRHAACTTFFTIANLIQPDDVGQHILTIILRLAHEDEKDELRMVACELLNTLAECLGLDLCKQFVIPEMVSLAEDPVFRVRKTAALNLHNICKVGGEHELFERLMPAFVRLSKDDMYRVRRACAESLSDISKNVSDDIRIGVLVECFLRLTQDPSRVVRQCLLQQSGIFIATLPNRFVSEAILAHFCGMANSPTGDASVDAELKHYCAFSFPAVLQTIGGGRWKELRGLYKSLLQCHNTNVRKTLAASLHEVARILADGSLVEEELVPVFEEMIQDEEPIQLGVIKHLAEFLHLLSEPCRVSYLPLLNDILHETNPFHWRLRQYVAAQLTELIMLPPRDNLYNSLSQLVMALLQDPVASVRRDSYRGVAKMLNLLNEQAERYQDGPPEDELDMTEELAGLKATMYLQQLEELVKSINMLAFGSHFQTRQLWFELCHRLLRDLPQYLFERYFVEGILILVSDPVCNVRVAGAVFLGGWAPEDAAPWEAFEPLVEGQSIDGTPRRASPWTWLMKRPDIRQCVQRLARDDRDVYWNVVKLQPLFPEIAFSQLCCRGYKHAPGGATPVQLDGQSLDASSGSLHVSSEDPSDAAHFTHRSSFSSLSLATEEEDSREEDDHSSHIAHTSRHSSGSIDISLPPLPASLIGITFAGPLAGLAGLAGRSGSPSLLNETEAEGGPVSGEVMVEYPPLPPCVERELANHFADEDEKLSKYNDDDEVDDPQLVPVVPVVSLPVEPVETVDTVDTETADIAESSSNESVEKHEGNLETVEN